MPFLGLLVKRGDHFHGSTNSFTLVLKPLETRFIVELMKKHKNEIRLFSTDDEINSIITQESQAEKTSFTMHFDYNEDFFIKLSGAVTVPSFPIHHDISQSTPSYTYAQALHTYMQRVVSFAPQIFHGLTYFFDPSDVHRPGFFHLYRIKDELFLYLLRLDLNFRTHYGEIKMKGGNDSTHTYKSNALFLENDIIPLSSLGEENRKVHSFFIKQHLSDTWIGEHGKGYFVQGIWIDRELTKFFSKLFLPENKRTYPYYPFPCKYQTICHSVLDFSPEGRKNHLKLLYHARSFLGPYFDEIQQTLKHSDFSEDLPLYRRLKQIVPKQPLDVWRPLKIHTYLNEDDMKEFQVDFHSQ